MEIDSELEEFARGLFATFPFSIGTWNGSNMTHVNESRHVPHYVYISTFIPPSKHAMFGTTIAALTFWSTVSCCHT
jgi:hypothetical protein